MLHFNKFLININDFKVLRSIKTDTYSTVYSVINQNTGQIYAAKVLKAIDDESKYKKKVSKVIGMLIENNNPTLIKFIGYSLTDFKGLNNATIFMDLAQESLSDFLSKQKDIDNTSRQKILIGISRAMMYLNQHKITHLDLKPSNILLDEKLQPHLTDYFISSIYNYYQVNDQGQKFSPNIYTAPEIIEGNSYTEKADVYSFGIIMYQIITNSIPYSSNQTNNQNLMQILKKVVSENYRPEFNLPIKKCIQNLIEKSWSKDPPKRPSFEEIFKKLAYNIDDSILDIYNEREYFLDNVDVEKIQLYVENIDNPLFLSSSDEISSKLIEFKKSLSQLESIIKPLKMENEQLKAENSELKIKLKEFQTEIDMFQKENVKLREQIELRDKNNTDKIIISERKNIDLQSAKENLKELTFNDFNLLPLKSKQLIISEIPKSVPELKEDLFFNNVNNLLICLLQYVQSNKCTLFKLVTKNKNDLLVNKDQNIEVQLNHELMDMILDCDKSELMKNVDKFEYVLVDFIYPSKTFDYFYEDMKKSRYPRHPIQIALFITGINKIFMGENRKSNITYVKLDSSVKEIGGDENLICASFSYMTSLVHIEIPNSVTTIGKNAFAYCSQLQVIEIPSSVTFIDDNAFLGCDSLKYIKFPSNLTYIGKEILNGCKSLKEVELPTLAYIGENAFSQCSNLTEVNLPTNITSFNEGIFRNCSSLKSFKIPSYITSILSNAFNGCSSLTDLEIPSSVKSIGSNAFSDCKSIKEVVIPSSIDSIESNAFENCSSLEKVEIQSKLHLIEPSLFSKCSSLTSITIPSSVEAIKDSAFSGCSLLTHINIPPSVTSIGKNVFENCSSLKVILLPDTLASIGERAFKDCSSIEKIDFPSKLSSIGSFAFYNCTSLKSISLSHCPLTIINNSVFSECKSITRIDIPLSICQIGDSSFLRCHALLNIHIPSGVTSIGSSAFYQCFSLSKIEIPSSVNSIKDSAFCECKSLVQINIPSSVTIIPANVFKGCESLTKIKIPDSVTSIGNSSFKDCKNLVYIDIPSSVVSIDIESFCNCCSLSNISIPPVKIIPEKAFLNCCSLLNIKIPDSVTEIHYNAFTSCKSLTEVDIPDSVTIIQLYSFNSCESLISVKMSKSINDINSYWFERCHSLSRIYVYDKTNVIGNFANPVQIIRYS